MLTTKYKLNTDQILLCSDFSGIGDNRNDKTTKDGICTPIKSDIYFRLVKPGL